MNAWSLVRSLNHSQRNTFIASFLGWSMKSTEAELGAGVQPEGLGEAYGS